MAMTKGYMIMAWPHSVLLPKVNNFIKKVFYISKIHFFTFYSIKYIYFNYFKLIFSAEKTSTSASGKRKWILYRILTTSVNKGICFWYFIQKFGVEDSWKLTELIFWIKNIFSVSSLTVVIWDRLFWYIGKNANVQHFFLQSIISIVIQVIFPNIITYLEKYTIYADYLKIWFLRRKVCIYGIFFIFIFFHHYGIIYLYFSVFQLVSVN